MPVHDMQNYCFSLLDMQICDVLRLAIISGELKAKTTAKAKAKTTPESNDLIGWMKTADRGARAGRKLIEFFNVTMWNFQIYGFNDNVNTQQQTINSFPTFIIYGASTSPTVA